MAIQIDVATTDFGVPFEAAYFRIIRAEISRREYFNETHSVTIDLLGYAAPPPPPPDNDTFRDIQQRRYIAPYSLIEAQAGENFLSKCYIWVMAQPDMAGCVPV